ncbi:type IV pilus biogenesis/stability protein PilW [Legionella sp. CNM-4043-24]|uniref:type IV pilus biogenesis/stability protein PilW n=1 Tax=Legionella sp. CNM-4043-24 TaxID=3421646 RepID=UPI00403AD9DE
MLLRSMRLLPVLGLVLLQACQYNAEAKAEKIEKAQKRDATTSLNIQMGMGYLKQGDMPRAKRKLLTALELEPYSVEATSAMAYYLETTGNIPEAKTYYLKALALSKNQGAQLNNYGTFLCRTGHYQEAETYFLKAVNDPNYVNTAAAYENAGLCATEVPDIQKAEQYFVKALEQDPRRNQSLYEVANIEMKQDHPDKALMYLQKYQELSLNDKTLLNLAVKAAQAENKPEVEAFYKLRLSKLNQLTDETGEKNEYDSSNG